MSKEEHKLLVPLARVPTTSRGDIHALSSLDKLCLVEGVGIFQHLALSPWANGYLVHRFMDIGESSSFNAGFEVRLCVEFLPGPGAKAVEHLATTGENGVRGHGTVV